MNAPAHLLDGRILLLSSPGSFHGDYIRRSLELFGVPLLVPRGSAAEAFAALSPADWMSVSACIAVDLGRSLLSDLPQPRQDIPFLFVGGEAGDWFPASSAWLAPPFAAYQVIEMLGEMVAAASAAMGASLRLATMPGTTPD